MLDPAEGETEEEPRKVWRAVESFEEVVVELVEVGRKGRDLLERMVPESNARLSVPDLKVAKAFCSAVRTHLSRTRAHPRSCRRAFHPGGR